MRDLDRSFEQNILQYSKINVPFNIVFSQAALNYIFLKKKKKSAWGLNKSF